MPRVMPSVPLDDLTAALDEAAAALDACRETILAAVRAEHARRMVPWAQVAAEADLSRYDLSRWVSHAVPPNVTSLRRLAAWVSYSTRNLP